MQAIQSVATCVAQPCNRLLGADVQVLSDAPPPTNSYVLTTRDYFGSSVGRTIALLRSKGPTFGDWDGDPALVLEGTSAHQLYSMITFRWHQVGPTSTLGNQLHGAALRNRLHGVCVTDPATACLPTSRWRPDVPRHRDGVRHHRSRHRRHRRMPAGVFGRRDDAVAVGRTRWPDRTTGQAPFLSVWAVDFKA